jgi:hypothetical protein
VISGITAKVCLCPRRIKWKGWIACYMGDHTALAQHQAQMVMVLRKVANSVAGMEYWWLDCITARASASAVWQFTFSTCTSRKKQKSKKFGKLRHLREKSEYFSVI